MKEQSTSKGFAILSIAGVMVKLLSLFYVPLLKRIIGIEGYGIYFAAYEVYTFVYVVTNSGMPTAISKQIAELLAVNNTKDAIKTFKMARGILLGMGMAMTLILIAFAGPIAKYTGNNKSYFAIIYLAPAVMVTTVLSAYRGYFQGRSLMTPTAVSQIIEQIVNVTLSLIFAKIMFDIGGVSLGAAGGTIGTVIGAVFAGIYLMYMQKRIRFVKRREIIEDIAPVKRLSNKQIVRKLFKYGIPITMSVGLQYLGNIIDLVIVKNRLFVAGLSESIGNEKYGLLGLYKTLINVPIAIISALSAAVIPAISKAVALGDKKMLREKINFAFKISYLISIPCAFGFSALSKDIYRLLFGSTEGHELLMYGSVLVVLMSIVQIQTVILQCANRFYPVLVSLGIGIVFKLSLNYVLVAKPEVNINGAIIGNIVCFAVPMLINTVIMRKSLKVRTGLLKHAIKPTISGGLMGIAVKISNDQLHFLFSSMGNNYLIATIITIICIGVGMMVYGYAMILTGGITKKDLSTFPNKLVKLIPGFMKRRLK